MLYFWGYLRAKSKKHPRKRKDVFIALMGTKNPAKNLALPMKSGVWLESFIEFDDPHSAIQHGQQVAARYKRLKAAERRLKRKDVKNK